MKVLKNIGFGLTFSFLFMGFIAGVECFGLFGLAMPIANAMKAAGYNGYLTLGVAFVCMVGPILAAWKPMLRYIDWLEPELRRRERENTQWFRARRAARTARAAG